ncbi:MAG: hypothetical protein IJE05_03340 [Clostridia bacterium]|nr:hypothetical protein [Clostridia bacterium]
MKNLFKEALRFMTLRERLEDELLNYELSKREELTKEQKGKYGIQKDTTSGPNGHFCPKRNVPNGQEEDKDYER